MLDIGWSELLLVAIVAIVVVGPKDLPRLMRTIGNYAGRARRAASDFKRQFSEAVEESEAAEVQENIAAIRANMGTAADFRAPIDEHIMTPMAELDAPQPEEAGAPAAKKRATKKQPSAESGTKTAKAPTKRAKSATGATAKTARPRRAKTGAQPRASAKRKKPARPKP